MVSVFLQHELSGADWIRYVGIVMGFCVTGWLLALLTSASHYRRPPRPILIGIVSFLMLEIGWIVQVYSKVGDPFSWRTPFVIVANTVALVSMPYAWRYYKHEARIRRHARRNRAAIMVMIQDLARHRDDLREEVKRLQAKVDELIADLGKIQGEL